jgi:hypothetical protein
LLAVINSVLYMVGLTWFTYSNKDLNGNIFSMKNDHIS